jgi:hypothetical protein
MPEIGARFTKMFDPNVSDRADELAKMISEEVESAI